MATNRTVSTEELFGPAPSATRGTVSTEELFGGGAPRVDPGPTEKEMYDAVMSPHESMLNLVTPVKPTRTTAQRMVDPYVRGAKGAAAGLSRTVSNMAGIVDKVGDVVQSITGEPKKAIYPKIRDYFATMAKDITPEQLQDESLVEKIITGTVEGVLKLPEYAAFVAAGGPILGFAAHGAVSEADKGPAASAKAAASGGLTGGLFKVTEPLRPAARAVALGGSTGASTLAEGGNIEDAIAAGVTMGAMGGFGHKPKGIPREPIRPENITPRVAEGRRVAGAEFEYEGKTGKTKTYTQPAADRQYVRSTRAEGIVEGRKTLREALQAYSAEQAMQNTMELRAEQMRAETNAPVEQRRAYEQQEPTAQERTRIEELQEPIPARPTFAEQDAAIQAEAREVSRAARESAARDRVMTPEQAREVEIQRLHEDEAGTAMMTPEMVGKVREGEPGMPLLTPQDNVGIKATPPFKGETLGVGDTGESRKKPSPIIPPVSVADMTLRQVSRMRGELGETDVPAASTPPVKPAGGVGKKASPGPQPRGGVPPTSSGPASKVETPKVEKPKAAKETPASASDMGSMTPEMLDSLLGGGKVETPKTDTAPDYASEAKKAGVTFNGMQDHPDGHQIALFTDPKSGSTFAVNPGQTVGEKLKVSRKLNGVEGEASTKTPKVPKPTATASAKAAAKHASKALSKGVEAMMKILGDERGSIPVLPGKGKPADLKKWDEVRALLKEMHDASIKAGQSMVDFVIAVRDKVAGRFDIRPYLERYRDEYLAEAEKATKAKATTSPITGIKEEITLRTNLRAKIEKAKREKDDKSAKTYQEFLDASIKKHGSDAELRAGLHKKVEEKAAPEEKKESTIPPAPSANSELANREELRAQLEKAKKAKNAEAIKTFSNLLNESLEKYGPDGALREREGGGEGAKETKGSKGTKGTKEVSDDTRALMMERFELERKIPEMEANTRTGRAMDALLNDKELDEISKATPGIVMAAERRLSEIRSILHKHRIPYPDYLQVKIDYLEGKIKGIKEAAHPTASQLRVLKRLESEQDITIAKQAAARSRMSGEKLTPAKLPEDKADEAADKWAKGGKVHTYKVEQFPEGVKPGDIVNVKVQDENRKGMVLRVGKSSVHVQVKPQESTKGGMVSVGDAARKAGLEETPKEKPPKPVRVPEVESPIWSGPREKVEPPATIRRLAVVNADIEALSKEPGNIRNTRKMQTLLLERSMASIEELKRENKELEKDQAYNDLEDRVVSMDKKAKARERVDEPEAPTRTKPGPKKKNATEEREKRIQERKEKEARDLWERQKREEEEIEKRGNTPEGALLIAQEVLGMGKKGRGKVSAKEQSEWDRIMKAFGTTITNERGSAPVILDIAEGIVKGVRKTVDTAKMTTKKMDTLLMMAGRTGRPLGEFAAKLGFSKDEVEYLKAYAGVGNEKVKEEGEAPAPKLGPKVNTRELMRTKDYLARQAERRAAIAEGKLDAYMAKEKERKAKERMGAATERDANRESALLYRKQKMESKTAAATPGKRPLLYGQHDTSNPYQTGAVVKQRDVGTTENPLWAPAVRMGERKIIEDIGAKDLPANYLQRNFSRGETGGHWSIKVAIENFDKMGEGATELVRRPLLKGEHNANVAIEQEGVYLKNLTKGLSTKSLNRIGISLISRRTGGRDHLKKMKVKIPTLTAREEQVATAINSRFKDLFDMLNDARQRSGLKPFRQVKDYITFFEDYSMLQKMGENPSASPTHLMENRFVHMRSTPFRFKHERKDIYPVKTNALDIYKTYAVEAFKHIHVGPEIAKAREMIDVLPSVGKKGTPGYLPRYSLKEKAPNAYRFLSNYLDYAAGKKIDMHLSPIAERAISQLTNNIAVSTMGGNFRSTMIQPTSLLNAHNVLGSRYLLQGILDVMHSDIRELARTESNRLLGRNFDASAMNVYKSGVLGKTGKALQGVKRFSMKGLTELDYLSALATRQGAYRKALAEGMSRDKANNYADDVVVRTQGSASVLDRAPIQQHVLGRAMTVFQTFVLANWSFMKGDVAGVGRTMSNGRRFINIAKYVGGAALINMLFENLLQTQSPFPAPLTAASETLEESGSKPWAAVMAALEMTQAAPLVGSMRFGSSALGAVADLVAGDIPRKFSGRQGPTRALPEIAGKLSGLPFTQQAAKSLRAAKKGVGFPQLLWSTKEPKSAGGEI